MAREFVPESSCFAATLGKSNHIDPPASLCGREEGLLMEDSLLDDYSAFPQASSIR